MKQLMIDMMAQMMPFMRPLSFIAFALVATGLVLGLLSRSQGSQSRLARWCGTAVLTAGLFFLACEIAGRFLGFAPTILYADPLDREMFRNQWPFWIVGTAFLLAGLIVRSISGRARISD